MHTESASLRLPPSAATPGHHTLLCTGQHPNTQLLQALDARTVDGMTGLARTQTQTRTRRRHTSFTIPTSDDSPTVEAGADALAAALAQIALLDADASADAPGSPSLSRNATSEMSEEQAQTQEELEQEEQAGTEPTPYPHIFVVGDAADAFGAIPAGHNAYWQAGVAARNVLALMAACSDEKGEARVEGDAEGEQVVVELERYTPGPPAIKVSLGLRKNVYQVNGEVGVGTETRDDLNAASIWGYFGCPIGEGEEAGMWR
ncbi:hypothetical protein C8F04DRAFT_1283615 [Mycena alexandri]|uniref:FAD/NAD(P)-binding domain-containing protein n=1 Tax=Mycena alexandri TaxID=1745969 RepID=A0AAD6WKU3_9AGAR|nr:hypothetical protein C8F04DRAFT_1283615 [Mycena alexandri]